jgi:GDSL-like Lipase/Acylhydrolase family
VSRHWLSILPLTALLLVVNPAMLQVYLEWEWLRAHFNPAHYHGALLNALTWIVGAWALGSIAWIGIKDKNLRSLWQSHAGYNLYCWFAAMLCLLVINPMYAGRFQLFRFCLLLLLTLLWMRCFYLSVVRNSANGKEIKFKGIATLIFSVGFLLHLTEGGFMFAGRSHSNNTSLASRVWFERYWQVNSMGFRDPEWDFKNTQKKKSLLLIGDSFVAGHGIKDTQNRFGDLIQQHLGNKWSVYNLGLNGADTQTEDSVLTLIPPASEELVLICWYVNDIEDRALTSGIQANYLGKHVSPISLTQGSYLFNFITSLYPDPEEGIQGLHFLHQAFATPEVRQLHLNDLSQLSQNAKNRGAKVAVILFPMILNISGSEFALNPIKNHLASSGIQFLDLSEAFSKYEANALIVNSSDSHPNQLGNEIAADAILQFLKRENLLSE